MELSLSSGIAMTLELHPMGHITENPAECTILLLSSGEGVGRSDGEKKRFRPSNHNINTITVMPHTPSKAPATAEFGTLRNELAICDFYAESRVHATCAREVSV